MSFIFSPEWTIFFKTKSSLRIDWGTLKNNAKMEIRGTHRVLCIWIRHDATSTLALRRMNHFLFTTSFARVAVHGHGKWMEKKQISEQRRRAVWEVKLVRAEEAAAAVAGRRYLVIVIVFLIKRQRERGGRRNKRGDREKKRGLKIISYPVLSANNTTISLKFPHSLQSCNIHIFERYQFCIFSSLTKFKFLRSHGKCPLKIYIVPLWVPLLLFVSFSLGFALWTEFSLCN